MKLLNNKLQMSQSEREANRSWLVMIGRAPKRESTLPINHDFQGRAVIFSGVFECTRGIPPFFGIEICPG